MNDIKQSVDPYVARALWLSGSGLATRRSDDAASPHHRRSSPRDPVELFPGEARSRPLILMSYAVGDYVVPVDLPRRFVCRIACAHPVGNTPLQVLELAPLEGPWAPETRLIRGGDSVRPAVSSELAGLRRARAMRAGRTLRPWRRSRSDRGSIRTPRRLEVSSGA